MKRFFLPLMALCLSLPALSIPAAPAQGTLPKPAPAVPPFNVTLLDDGMFQVGEARVKLGQLTDKLKSLHVPASTPIRVALPKDAPEATLRAIGAKLASDGYRRFMFMKPRRTESFADSDTGIAPLPRPRTPPN